MVTRGQDCDGLGPGHRGHQVLPRGRGSAGGGRARPCGQPRLHRCAEVPQVGGGHLNLK